jgi:hypothetical protein
VKRVTQVSDIALVLPIPGVERVEVEQDVAREVGVQRPEGRRITVRAGAWILSRSPSLVCTENGTLGSKTRRPAN